MLSVLPLGVLTAQEEKDYLPKAGDWAIGIDMQPVYEFFGNLFYTGEGGIWNRNTLGQFGGEDALGITGNVTLLGKYMLDNTTAIRANIGVQKNVDYHYEYQPDNKAQFENPFSEQKVEDFYRENIAAYSFAAGIEFRKGKNRIQGFYGADLLFGVRKDRYVISYGNAITQINQTPDRTAAYNGLGPIGVQAVPYWSQAYLTESYTKRTTLGIAGKLGVEYFVVPKLAFGGEVSLVFAENFEKGSYVKSEGFNPSSNEVEERTELIDPANRQLYIGTTDLGGKLFMIFYF